LFGRGVTGQWGGKEIRTLRCAALSHANTGPVGLTSV
jgi:hypothetical protein